VLLAYLGSRLAFACAAFFGAAMLPLAPAWPGQIAVSERAWLAVHWRWDALYYYTIALYGYAPPAGAPVAREGVVAFFPLFPLLSRGVALLLGGGRQSQVERWLPLSGVLVANIAMVLALVLLFQLAFDETGQRELADRTVLYAAVFPLAWYYSLPYAESLFLAASLAMFVAARRGRWIAAGLAAAAASATRPFGVLLAVPLALEMAGAWRRGELGAGRWRAAAGLLLAPCGLLLFMLHLWRTAGDPLAFMHAQQEVWNRHTVFPLLTVWRAIELVARPSLSAHADMYARTVLHTAMLVAFLGVLLVSSRRWRPSWVVYGLLLFGQLLSTPWPGATLMHAVGRSAMVFFPVYLALARWGRHPAIHHAILALWLPLFGLLAALYACWYFVA